LNLPLAVLLIRLAAPRWVFSFGMAGSFSLKTSKLQ
jgi:hypothetical protein